MRETKTYIKPTMKSVELKNNMAILTACKIGGGYFSGPLCVYGASGGGWTCDVTPKGGTGTVSFVSSNEDSQPS